jgi:hypothetical protein
MIAGEHICRLSLCLERRESSLVSELEFVIEMTNRKTFIGSPTPIAEDLNLHVQASLLPFAGSRRSGRTSTPRSPGQPRTRYGGG